MSLLYYSKNGLKKAVQRIGRYLTVSRKLGGNRKIGSVQDIVAINQQECCHGSQFPVDPDRSVPFDYPSFQTIQEACPTMNRYVR